MPSRLKNVRLFVEGLFDRKIVLALFKNSGYPIDRISVEPVEGKRILQAIPSQESDDHLAVLFDADTRTVADAESEIRRFTEAKPEVRVFCAIPTIEAWIFADVSAAQRFVKTSNSKFLLRLPPPEEIPYPKDLAKRAFETPEDALAVVEHMNLETAASRSPTLRRFLIGIASLLRIEHQRRFGDRVYARSLNRDLIAALVSEIEKGDTIVFRTMDGKKVTASVMIQEIREGSALGELYATELLRVSRDLLARNSE